MKGKMQIYAEILRQLAMMPENVKGLEVELEADEESEDESENDKSMKG